MRRSYQNLLALVGDGPDAQQNAKPLGAGMHGSHTSSVNSMDSCERSKRVIIVSNHLPIHAKRSADDSSWEFDWDEDALVAQAKDGLEDNQDVHYVGCLSVDVSPSEHEAVRTRLRHLNCSPVFLGKELKEKYYKGCCKQQLWPLLHYVLPMSPASRGRFDQEMWQAYKRANMMFAQVVICALTGKQNHVWIHDYHLLVLPCMLRMRMESVRVGLFLHSPFPSSEIFRTYPKRHEVLRSMLNADLIGFHTFDYARHFLSCCSRMLGLDHNAYRGSLALEYYGRNVGIKIMPTGVNPERLLSGFNWSETKWRRGELLSEFEGKTVMIGVDDLDQFKGIELKLEAFQRVLELHPEWRKNLCLVQITNAPRTSGREVQELVDYVRALVASINDKFGTNGYQPVKYLERHVPLHERIAFYSVADVLVVSATRDGMNLAPYEYVVCRQGAPKDSSTSKDEEGGKTSMLVLSEFVGCSPSLCGAIRVNPWSVMSLADGMREALGMSVGEQIWRHEKHWNYVSKNTVGFWAQSYISELERLTQDLGSLISYRMGLGLDTFKMVSLDRNFRKLETIALHNVYKRSNRRVFLLDYDGTLVPATSVNPAPSAKVITVLKALCSDPKNMMYIISGRSRKDLSEWFGEVEGLGLAAEHGYFYRKAGTKEWEAKANIAENSGWMALCKPVLQSYRDATDGSRVEVKESSIVWHFRDADPDFGNWQAKELVAHLEEILSCEPVEVVRGQSIVEVKHVTIGKGQVVERVLQEACLAEASGPDFILCIGDDRSDEIMFDSMKHVTFSPHMPAEVFACTVGQKPSKAKFYVDDPENVLSMFEKLAM